MVVIFQFLHPDRAFAKSLETDSNYIFILMSFDDCEKYDVKTFYKHIQDELYDQLIHRLDFINCNQLNIVRQFLNNHQLTNNSSFYNLFKNLNEIINQKKIVIFIDEFDGIPLDELKSFLTTLRILYQKYKDKTDKALYSVGLIGIRNITQLIVDGVSPFNIADHVELPSFNIKNIRELYDQYTKETNQPFLEETIQQIYEQTQGQPWLVNRLASILTKKVKPETTYPISMDDVNEGIKLLLKEKNSHFENIKEKILLYRESFNKIASENIKYLPDDDAQSWLYQYGLIKEKDNYAVIANPIYKKRFSTINEKQIKFENIKKKIFISYNHEDRKWLDKLIIYLNPLKYNNIEYWFDDRIQTGQDWSAAIQNAIQTSHMAICLISPYYISSDFIRTREVPAILNKQKEGMIIFPILIENCLWHIIEWLNQIQFYPKGPKPLDEFNEVELKNKLIDIVSEISNMLINID